jgi:transglutaminase-like putative cysteine protease
MNQTLDQVVQELFQRTGPCPSPRTKALRIYDWITRTIAYDHERKKQIDAGEDDGSPHAPEATLRKRMGVCSDQAWLYVALARRMGLEAQYAYVELDGNLGHACAIVDLPEGRVQVDPAYQIFEAHHPRYQILDPTITEDTDILRDLLPRLRWPTRAKKGVLVTIAAMLCAAGLSLFAEHSGLRNHRAATHRNENRFTTRHGEVRFTVDAAAHHAWKEALFYREMTDEPYDDDALDAFLDADANGDNRIAEDEARTAREKARDTYVRSRQR